MLVGAINGAAPLVAMGGIVIASLLGAYLWFFPAAILLRRRKVELSWWVPPGDLPGGTLSVDRPLPLHIALRNHGGRRLRVLGLQVLTTSALDPPVGLEAVMPPGKQVEIVGSLLARQPGYHVLHGTTLRFGDVLGLFEVAAYFPNALAIKVFPHQANIHATSIARPQGGALHQRQGLHQVRRRGLAGELREIREYSHGDPFKNIAWKSTARHRKLMVRDLENEIVLTHQYLLDIGGSMRSGTPGHSRLDHGIRLITTLSKLALDRGDRVGMVTYDSRIYSQLPAAEGHHQYLQLIDRLVETHNIVDEDLTDLTNSELVAAVARYLAHQEAVDVRVQLVPALDDPLWEQIQAGPKGELYDLRALGRIVEALLKSMGQARRRRDTTPAWCWSEVRVGEDSSPDMARLRLFARLRGIELPYRYDHEHGRRAQGFADALNKAATGPRADNAVLITDLGGLLEDPKVCLQALSRARRGGRQVVAVVPYTASASDMADSPAQKLVAEVLVQEETLRLARAKRLLLQAGVPLITVGAHDNAVSILARISQARSTLRRGRAPSAA